MFNIINRLLVIAVVSVTVFYFPSVGNAEDVIRGPFRFSPGSYNFTHIIGGNPPTVQSGTFTSISYSGNIRFSVPNKPAWLNTSYNTEPYPVGPGPSGIGAGVNPEGLAAGTYATELHISGDFAGSPAIVPITLTVLPAGSRLPDNQIHPEGTNILTSDGTVYRIMIGIRVPYTSAGAFLSYGYNSWADVQPANAADLALPVPERGRVTSFIRPRDGSLINDNGTVYIVFDNHRQGFVSAQVFLGLGYSFENVLTGDTSFLRTLAPITSSEINHPSGTVINDNGTICVVESLFQIRGGSLGRKCFSNLADMNSWGIKTREILAANSFDRALPISGVIRARAAHSMMNP